MAPRVARFCSIEGCEQPYKARGLCGAHYCIARREGTLPPKGTKRSQVIQDPLERWFAKVKDGPVPDHAPHLGTCWIWTAYCNPLGYGRFGSGGPEGTRFAHRWGYEALVGPIPEGLYLDHLCRVPSCVNPRHLEPVTQQENLRRGASGRGDPDPDGIERCRNGHRMTPENTCITPGRPGGKCRTCGRLAMRRSRDKKKSASRVDL